MSDAEMIHGINDRESLVTENYRLRDALQQAVEALQIVGGELQAAHDELAAKARTTNAVPPAQECL